MAATAFRAVVFQPNDLLSEDILNQIATNQTWLFENKANAIYTFGNINRKEGVRIVSGRAVVGATKKNNASTTVRFGNFFSSGCRPNITHGVVSAHWRRFYVTIDGIGVAYPDNRGFQIHVYLESARKNVQFSRTIHIPWIAMGY